MFKVNIKRFSEMFNVKVLFIERQKKRSKSLVQGPGVRKNLSVIESYTTDTV